MSMNFESTSLAELRSLASALGVLERKEKAEHLEASLIDFVREAWPAIDPAPYQGCWAIEVLCEHLQAVSAGQIRNLLVNFPPRCGKTTIASICYPAWTWAQSEVSFLNGPQVRFLCGSYNHDLSLTNSNLTRRLILSPWYQSLWGHRFKFREDQNTKTKFDTSAGGSRLATSVGGSLLGIGGDVILIDDPHNTEEAESEAERKTALNWWKEISTTRLNDPKRTPLIVVMQRLHEEDVSGQILSSEWSDDWTHLCIPMEYESRRHCITVLGWEDPRGLDKDGRSLLTAGRVPRDTAAQLELEEREGTLMWPERFGAREVARIKAELGPYMASGRLQQMPVPDQGGIFQRDWWQVWDPPDGKFPVLSHIVASLDGAFTEKEENDPSALTIWGVFQDEDLKNRVMLVHAWRKHLPFSGVRNEKPANETLASFKHRTRAQWGLLEWVNDTCDRFKVDLLLIENKGPGISAAQDLQNRFGQKPWSVQLAKVKGDKIARALAAQATFSQLMVYAPIRDWSQMVIDEMANFPKGRYDDLTDSTTQAISYLRSVGLARTDAEVAAERAEATRHRRRRALYPC
jgi:predicted phage terminase large subunit-like protein